MPYTYTEGYTALQWQLNSITTLKQARHSKYLNVHLPGSFNTRVVTHPSSQL